MAMVDGRDVGQPVQSGHGVQVMLAVDHVRSKRKILEVGGDWDDVGFQQAFALPQIAAVRDH